MRSLPQNNHQWAIRLAVLASLFYLSLTASAAEQADIPGDLQGLGAPAELERFIDEVMTDHFNRYAIAGASVTVVKDGGVFFSKGYGHADVAAGLPVEADVTLFGTASVAKLFVWTAVMQLVEQGTLDLEAEVNSYLSAFKIPETFPEPVRVWHLLSHTAGFEDKPVIGLLSRTADNLPTLETLLIRLMPARVWPPGLYAAYNNYSTALAAYLVAEVSGMSWEDYADTHIFAPLGMTSASFRQPLPEGLAGNLTKVYASNEGGLLEVAYEYVPLAPVGGAVATTQDMGRFMLAHLQGGGLGDVRILQEVTVQRMHAQLFTHDSRLPGNAHGFWEGFENGQRVLSHAGDTSSHTVLALVPEHDLGLYVAYNSAEGALAREDFWQAFLDYAFPTAEAATVQELLEGTHARLEGFAGTYGSNRISTTTLAKLWMLFSSLTISAEDGFLVTDIPGLEPQRWVEVGANEFAEVGGQKSIVFRNDDDGRISHVFFSNWPLMAAVPLAWYETATFHGSVLAASLLMVLSALMLWPVLAFVQHRRGTTNARGARVARWWAAATGGLYFLFIVLFAFSLLNPTEVEFGVPALLNVALTLGVGMAVLSLGVVVHTVLAWRNRYWAVAGRVHYTLLTLAFVAFVWQLNFWNLLGFRG